MSYFDTPSRASDATKHPTRYFCENPATHRMEEVFPESEVSDGELVIPMFWSGKGYVTVPGTEFYAREAKKQESTGGK